MEDLIKELGSKIDAFKETSVSKEDLATLKQEFETLKSQGADVTALKGQIDELALTLKDVQEKGVSSENKESLVNVIKENKEQLKEMSKGKSGEITVKANLVRASIATNPLDLMLSGVGQLARRARSLYDFFPKIQVGTGNHNGTISYIDWDEATTVKAAANVAEGVAFAESTATFKGYTLPLRKIGDTLPVSEEFFEDEVMAAAELERFLATNVEDRIDTQIVTGDNTGQNLAGLVSSVPAYTPVASGIADANIYDLCVKVMESITSTGGAKYRPDFVAMNIADINKLRLKKSTDNTYVFDRNDDRIVSLNIIEDNNVVANTLYIGDSRFATIYEMGGVVLSEGMINAQFTSDLRTIKARKRLAFLIREADKSGFRRVTSISAALTTLAT
jgi:HK97 family phage major capsid protein